MRAPLTEEEVARRTEEIIRTSLKEDGTGFSAGRDLAECGMDSLMTLELVGRLETEFGCLLELEEIVNCRSTDAVAAYVHRALALRKAEQPAMADQM